MPLERHWAFFDVADELRVYGSTASVALADKLYTLFSRIVRSDSTEEDLDAAEALLEEFLAAIRDELGIPKGTIDPPISRKLANRD